MAANVVGHLKSLRAAGVVALTIAVLGALVVVSEPATAAVPAPAVCVGLLNLSSTATATSAVGGATCPIHAERYDGTVGHSVNLCQPGVHKMPIVERQLFAGIAPRSTIWTFDPRGTLGLLTVTSPSGKRLATGVYEVQGCNFVNLVRVEGSQPLPTMALLSCHVQGSIALFDVSNGDTTVLQGTATGAGACASIGAPWHATIGGARFEKIIGPNGCAPSASTAGETDFINGIMQFKRPGGPPVPMDQSWSSDGPSVNGTSGIVVESGDEGRVEQAIPVGAGTLSYAPDFCNETDPAWFAPHAFTADIVFLLV